MMGTSHVSRFTHLLLCLAYILTTLSCSLGQIQCPQQPVTKTSEGALNFDSFGPGSEPMNASYNPGVIGGWYSLASGFVDVVRPGNLPYDQILSALNATGVQCQVGTKTGCPTTSDFNVQQTLTSFGMWWISLIILTIFGGILGFCFCICGMCFCCCRCCGKCGGSKTQEITDNMDCKAFTFTIILFLFVLLLFVGVVLAFFSNQQTYESLDNVQNTINSVADLGVNYINDTINEFNSLVCQLAAENGVAGFVIDETEEFNSTLQDVTNGIQNNVDMILGNITELNPGYNATIDALERLSVSSDITRNSGSMLTASVMSISVAISSIRDTCSMLPAGGNSSCGQLPNPLTLTAGADFSQLPNVSQELSDVRQSLANINLQDDVEAGRQDFSNIRESIENTVSVNIDEGVAQLRNYNESLFGIIDNLTTTVQSYINNDYNISNCPPNYQDGLSNVEFNVGFLRQCIINRGFDFVQQNDVYRYAFGIIICSLALVTVILIMTGILMGMFGFRKECNPEERSGLSHCGGIFLVIGVIVTFVFGFILLILCAIFFFFGSNAQKLCQAVEAPNYPVFEQIIDNREFWGASLLGTLLPTSPNNTADPEIYLTGIFDNCEADKGLYSAANLSLLIPSGSISQQINDLVNLDQIKQMLNTVLSNTTSDFNFNDTSFLSTSAQDALDEFRNASVDQINITAYREQIDSPLVNFNITEAIGQLEMVNTMLSTNPAAIPLMTNITNVIADLANLRDVQIPGLMGQVDVLEGDVNNLVNVIDTVVVNTSVLVDEINGVIQNITGETLPQFLDENVVGAISRVFQLLDAYITHVDTQLSQNVGRCRPLWIIYMEIYNTGCRNFLDGLNGFWWSLGFCAILFIPVIIFSVVTSNYFLKKKSRNDDVLDDYPLKSY